MDDIIEWMRSQVADRRLQQNPDEIELLEKHRESYEDFVQNLFSAGHTHVGYGENHGKERLHSSVVQLVPRLKESSGLSYVCLELESETQEDIDRYMETGDDTYITRIEANQPEGYEDRIGTSYFDILRISRDSGISVIAMDNHKKKNRDKFMANRVPSDGNTLIYVGQGHLMENGIPKYFRQSTGIQIYRIWQVLSQSSEDDITSWLDSLVEQSDVLKQSNGFALNLEKEGLHHLVDRHETNALLGSGSTARNFDGLLYHR